MGFRLPGIRRGSFTTTQAAPKSVEVPKGYLAVSVGPEIKRFIIPISYLNQPFFQELLSQTEEEFGYHHPMGGYNSLQGGCVCRPHVSPEYAINLCESEDKRID